MNEIGLALGSGGARGLAHIGVLDQLEEMGITPSCIAGCSMGSLVGACYCSGHLADLRELALKMDIRTLLFRIMDYGMPRSGLVEGKRIHALLDELMPNATFNGLGKPFRCVATDLKSGKEVVFSKGRVQPAIRASISIPGLFAPMEIDGRYLVDGGLVNPVPVDQARAMGAKMVIAVDVNQGCLSRPPDSRKKTASSSSTVSDWLAQIERKVKKQNSKHVDKLLDWFKPDPAPNLIDVIGSTIHIIENQITRIRLKLDPPDLLLAPAVGDIQILDFHHAEDVIEAGRACVKKNARKISALCE